MKADSLQTPAIFQRMIEAHGDQALIESFLNKRPSVGERLATGKALRAQVPRSAQATYSVRPDRPDPIELLEQEGATRVQELLPIRYGRMLANSFAYFRGAAAMMASDLSTLPISGVPVVACGDAHLRNFGVYASAERNLVFAINDYDEVYVAPWALGSGTSNVWRPAPLLRRALWELTRCNAKRSPVSVRAATVSTSIGMLKWGIWKSGMTVSTSAR